jgi:hypothetical protein
MTGIYVVCILLQDANLHGADYAKYKAKILARDYYFEERSASETDEEDNDYAGEI